MTVDNFDAIKNLLNFETDDDFYHLQVIKRKKENPELGSHSCVLNTYYVDSKDYLERRKDEIISLCKSNNARAYINLNRRSFEKIAFNVLSHISNLLLHKNYKAVRRIYESVCGAVSNEPDKKWIVDIDQDESGYEGMLHKAQIVASYIREQYSKLTFEQQQKCFLEILRTKNGLHIICSPFRLDLFNEKFPDVDVHKDNPTILFIP